MADLSALSGTLRIGTLRERVAVQRLTEEPDTGTSLRRVFITETWLWAALDPALGRLMDRGRPVAGRGDAKARCRFWVRWRADLLPLSDQDRHLYWPRQRRRFRILAVREPLVRGRYLEIEAEEVQQLPPDLPDDFSAARIGHDETDRDFADGEGNYA